MLRAWLSDVTAKEGRGGKPIAAATVAQAYRTLNRVLAAAVDDELIGRNPLRGVKPPRIEPQPMRFLTHDQVATLTASVDERYRALVYVAAYTGLRAGEIGRASCRESGCQYVSISVVAVCLKKHKTTIITEIE